MRDCRVMYWMLRKSFFMTVKSAPQYQYNKRPNNFLTQCTYTAGQKFICTPPQAFLFLLALHYKKPLRGFCEWSILYCIMPIIYTVIFGFEYLSICTLLKNEAKHINILQRKNIRTERKNVYFIY